MSKVKTFKTKDEIKFEESKEYMINHLEELKKQVEQNTIKHIVILSETASDGYQVSMSGVPSNIFEGHYCLQNVAPDVFLEAYLEAPDDDEIYH